MSIKRYEMTGLQREQGKPLFLLAKAEHPFKDNRMIFNAVF